MVKHRNWGRMRDPNTLAGTKYNGLACRFGVQVLGVGVPGLEFGVLVSNEFEVNLPVSASAAPMNGFGEEARSR